MDILLFILLLFSVIAFVIGLIRPSIIKMGSRKKVLKVGSVTIVVLFILFAIAVPELTAEEHAAIEERKQAKAEEKLAKQQEKEAEERKKIEEQQAADEKEAEELRKKEEQKAKEEEARKKEEQKKKEETRKQAEQQAKEKEAQKEAEQKKKKPTKAEKTVTTKKEKKKKTTEKQEKEIKLDVLQQLYVDINEKTNYKDIIAMIEASNLPYSEKEFSSGPSIKVAFEEGVTPFRYADSGDHVSISLNKNSEIENIEYFNNDIFITLVDYRQGTYWDFRDQPEYAGYYINTYLDKAGDFTIKYDNGNEVNTKYLKVRSKKEQLEYMFTYGKGKE